MTDYMHPGKVSARLFTPISLDGRLYERAAWTGGTPPRPIRLIDREERRLVGYFFREQIEDWRSFWHAFPEKGILKTFWIRARYDAHATLRHMGRVL